MSQYDVILKFASKAAALDAMQEHAPEGKDEGGATIRRWLADRVVPDLKVWRASQDTTETVAGPNGDYQRVVHNYLPGYFVLISLDRRLPALENHAAVQVVINRDKQTARQVGGVVRSTVGPVILQDLRFEPVLLGSAPPWGAMT